MSTFEVLNTVNRFPGEHGWYYVELDEKLSTDLRPLVKDVWPALLKAEFTLGKTSWQSSVMPIKDGPLFIALPAKVRTAESIIEGQTVKVSFELL